MKNFKAYKNYGYFIILALFLGSCQDVIEVETDPAPTLMVVDAWLDNLSRTQSIRITQSQEYFNSNPTPGISGAIVSVTSSTGETYDFADQGDGNYTWTPDPGENIGNVGDDFALRIELDGSIYSATSPLNDTPVIDSITQEFREDEFLGDGIYTEFFSRDLLGLGDTYWIKTYKNGAYLNKPEEINIAYDAGIDAGAEVDGLIFIPPIREAINPVSDDDSEDDSPWNPGDVIRVEIHSISNEAFAFMEIARDQILNGLNTIFAEPLANSRGNIVNENGEEEVLGVFCVSAISSLEKVIE